MDWLNFHKINKIKPQNQKDHKENLLLQKDLKKVNKKMVKKRIKMNLRQINFLIDSIKTDQTYFIALKKHKIKDFRLQGNEFNQFDLSLHKI